jgi:sugar phosphate isomerase/epimerase
MSAPGWHRSELTYCTNVHPGETLDDLLSAIPGAVGAVRKARSLSRMGSGMWINATAAKQLLKHPEKLAQFTRALDAQGIDLFTLNGFPYGGFHATRVKERVYTPHWADPARFEYSLNLARILSVCLPENPIEGTISSVPLGFAPAWNPELQQQALDALVRFASELERLEGTTGRRIRLCLEMEPGCVLESTRDAIGFFCRELPVAAKRSGVRPEAVARHLGVCFDVCHQAVMFEDIYTSLSHLKEAGISIGKIQVSSALELRRPGDAVYRSLLTQYVEPRYLHQVRTRTRENDILGSMDLDQVLASDLLPTEAPWRVHFHLPIQSDQFEQHRLHSTQTEITGALRFLDENRDQHPHLEVETYTWQVLPESMRPTTEAELLEGLTTELQWLEARMAEHRLLQAGPDDATGRDPHG